MCLRTSSAVFLCAASSVLASCSLESPVAPECVGNTRSAVACHSDAALLEMIAGVNGRVSIGFKESGTAYGVDPDGRNVTTAETTIAMTQLVIERGVEVSYQFNRLPAVIGRIPLNAKLIGDLRRHPNVDYLEPDTFGTFSGR